MKKIFIWLFLSLAVVANAEEQVQKATHELRIGVGDDLVPRVGKAMIGVIPIIFGTENQELKSYNTLNLHFGYVYNATNRIGVGFQVNAHAVGGTYRNINDVVFDQRNLHIDFLPKVRFNYFRSRYVTMYGTISVGGSFVNQLSLDSENKPLNTITGGVMGFVSPFSIAIGNEHVFGALDTGFALGYCPSLDSFYNIGERLINVSIGYRF